MSDALQSEVETFLDEFRAAWDAGDARSYAALFTNEATYVIFLGEAFVGRDEIERNHLEVFARWQKARGWRSRLLASARSGTTPALS
jgi:uncharacterized protein (TIGR02246 family)